MKLQLKGDYYLWHCEWCDSRNQTIWTRFEKQDIHCSACQRRIFPLDNGTVSPNSAMKPSGYNLF